MFETVLKTTLTKEDWIQNTDYLYVLRGFPDFAINQRGFELIKNQVKLSIDVEKKLASKINEFYNKHIIELKIALEELSGEYRDNSKYLKNFYWFSDYMLNRRVNDGLIDYLTNNPNAKNRITLYYMLFNVYANELANFKTNAIDLIKQIDNYSLNKN